MNIFESIKSLLSQNKEDQPTPSGYCPNCWGKQEYGGQFYEAVKNENIDINNVNEKKGWIQTYADQHLGAIQLQAQDDKMVCQKCKVSYSAADSND